MRRLEMAKPRPGFEDGKSRPENERVKETGKLTP